MSVSPQGLCPSELGAIGQVLKPGIYSLLWTGSQIQTRAVGYPLKSHATITPLGTCYQAGWHCTSQGHNWLRPLIALLPHQPAQQAPFGTLDSQPTGRKLSQGCYQPWSEKLLFAEGKSQCRWRVKVLRLSGHPVLNRTQMDHPSKVWKHYGIGNTTIQRWRRVPWNTVIHIQHDLYSHEHIAAMDTCIRQGPPSSRHGKGR